MKLFECTDAKPAIMPAVAAIQTPLGAVRFEAVVDGIMMTEEPSTQTQRLASGSLVTQWHQQSFDLELLLCRSPLPRTSGAPVTDCWAVVWRLQAHAPVAGCTFTALWDTIRRWREGGPDTRQWLYAKNYTDGQTTVSIGTDDGDALARRAHDGEGLPSEWESYFRSTPRRFDWFSLQPVHYQVGDKGLAIPLPPLEPGKQCQIHFLLAWAPNEEDGWAVLDAVEQNISEIIAAEGCS